MNELEQVSHETMVFMRARYRLDEVEIAPFLFTNGKNYGMIVKIRLFGRVFS